MTAQTRSVLKGVFETGDTPDGSNYTDLIDSSLNLSDSTAQTVTSDLVVSGTFGVAATASSANLEVVGAARVSGDATFDSAITVSGKATFSTDIAVSGNVSAGTLHVLGAVTIDGAASALSMVITDNLSASAAAFSVFSAASVSFDTIVTAMVTASASGGSVMVVPTTAAGYIMAQVSGRTVCIPYFEIAS
jgi:hypothetical protein